MDYVIDTDRGTTIGKNGVKVSFRSKGSIPINELAKEFGGNGHLNAAGARLFDAELEEVVRRVVKQAGRYLGKD